MEVFIIGFVVFLGFDFLLVLLFVCLLLKVVGVVVNKDLMFKMVLFIDFLIFDILLFIMFMRIFLEMILFGNFLGSCK